MLTEIKSESQIIQTLFQMSGITPEVVHKQLQDIVKDSAQPLILFWDINDIVKATTFSRKFLEEHILPDPRIQKWERQREKGGKRIWLKEPTAKAIQDIIMNEWN